MREWRSVTQSSPNDRFWVKEKKKKMRNWFYRCPCSQFLLSVTVEFMQRLLRSTRPKVAPFRNRVLSTRALPSAVSRVKRARPEDVPFRRSIGSFDDRRPLSAGILGHGNKTTKRLQLCRPTPGVLRNLAKSAAENPCAVVVGAVPIREKKHLVLRRRRTRLKSSDE